jgi:geranylgeranyl transferase type-1 subunit beta
MTFCAVAALTLLGRLKDSGLQTSDAFIKWLVMRQTPFVGRHEIDVDDLEEWAEGATKEEKQRLDTAEIGADGKPIWAGFHGRCNKPSDTCYSFWVGASLDVCCLRHGRD